MSDSPAAARWRKLLAKHATTDLSTHDFAIKRGVKPGTLKWWRSNLKRLDAEQAGLVRSEPPPVFTELVVATGESTVVLAFDQYPAHIVVDHRTDLPLLKRVLEALC